MSEPHPAVEETVDSIDLITPRRLNGPARVLLADAVDRVLKAADPDSVIDLHALSVFAADVLDVAELLARPDPPPPMPDELSADERGRRAAELLRKLRSTDPPCAVPPNLFSVGVVGDYVVWTRPPALKLHKTEARNLAVWLAALADPKQETFLNELEAVVR